MRHTSGSRNVSIPRMQSWEIEGLSIRIPSSENRGRKRASILGRGGEPKGYECLFSVNLEVTCKGWKT